MAAVAAVAAVEVEVIRGGTFSSVLPVMRFFIVVRTNAEPFKRRSTAWYRMVRHGTAWYGMGWHGIVGAWCDVARGAGGRVNRVLSRQPAEAAHKSTLAHAKRHFNVYAGRHTSPFRA